ncbi:MAG TPA: protein-disulfide reductase DsbD [Gammaproteobacteria bacterium]|nr:protein-disulfide reductase DsbD [Gammaproteobacteria bacterium]
MQKIILLILSFILITVAHGEEKPLPASEAFVFTTFLEKNNRLALEWKITPGYYLYQDKFKIESSPNVKATGWPKAHLNHGSRVYEGLVHVSMPLAAKANYSITVKYQGCSSSGFCYPPVKKVIQLSFPFAQAGLEQAPLLTIQDGRGLPTANTSSDLLNDQAAAKDFMGSHNLWVIWLCFLGLGMLLAFTPCSLPMIPILSSIIIGKHQKNNTKAFFLSLSYVLGVAVTYAIAGIAIAWLGSSVQASLQNGWVIGSFSLLFVMLAASMLGWFDVSLPARLQQKIMGWQQKPQAGTYAGVFLMGCLSTLVVSPCVTAPLVGVLTYVTETGNLWLGGSALFALGLGMGLPLLAVGFSAGKYLPQSGPWMEAIKKIFGFMLLGMAIWMASRIMPEGLSLFMWAALFMAGAVYCFFFTEELSLRGRRNAYAMGTVLLVYGFTLFVGVALDYTSPLYPFEKWVLRQETSRLAFTEIKNMQQLNQLFQEAKQNKKPVVLDFYADWCESCRALEKTVLSKPEVQQALQSYVLLRANVSSNNAFDNELLKRYNVVAPPTFLFFNSEGRELAEKRIVGEVGQQIFLAKASNVE